MILYLVRHPQCSANVGQINAPIDDPVTTHGHWQVRRTTSFFATRQLDSIIASPATRCRVLAEALAKSKAARLHIDYGVRERDYGEWAGKPSSWIYDLGLYGRPPGGESVCDVRERAASFYASLGQRAGSVAIISHGLFLKAFVAAFLDSSLELAVKHIKFSNCAVSLLDCSSRHIEFMNQRAHLGPQIKRVHIFGSWSSGKTTLAHLLGHRFGLPVVSLDSLKYPNGHAAAPLSVQDRIAQLDRVTAGEEWVTEGCWTGYAEMAFARADLLIYLKVPLIKALSRATRREVTRDRIEGVSLLSLVTELIRYHTMDLPVSAMEHDRMADRYRAKTAINPEIDSTEFLEDLLV